MSEPHEFHEHTFYLRDGRMVHVTVEDVGLVEVTVSAYREEADDLTLMQGWFPPQSWEG